MKVSVPMPCAPAHSLGVQLQLIHPQLPWLSWVDLSPQFHCWREWRVVWGNDAYVYLDTFIQCIHKI